MRPSLGHGRLASSVGDRSGLRLLQPQRPPDRSGAVDPVRAAARGALGPGPGHPWARAWEAHNRRVLAQEGPSGSPSGTDDAGHRRFAPERGWAGQLSERLTGAGWDHRLVNLSASGARVEDVLDRQLRPSTPLWCVRARRRRPRHRRHRQQRHRRGEAPGRSGRAVRADARPAPA